MIGLNKALRPPEDLRNMYLDSLSEPQEHYLEILVSAGETWQFEDIGYAVCSGTKLVELFVKPNHIDRLREVFDAAMIASKATGVLCKSYDTQMLHAALSQPAHVKPGGLLFRRIVDNSHSARSDLVVRPGKSDDVRAILGINDDFFESKEEIQTYISSDGLFVLELESSIVGCGIGVQVIEDRVDVDIGMLVASEHRGKGYGTHIVSFLKQHYLKKNMNPICGCGPTNTGSKRSLEKAGFVSEHRFLEISY